MTERGKPRIDYARRVFLAPPECTKEEWLLLAGLAYGQRSTVTGSADDCGIGNLSNRTVIAYQPERWKNNLREWFAEHYPEVKYEILTALKTTDKVKEVPNIRKASDVRRTPNHTLCGLHLSCDGNWHNRIDGMPDFDICKTARVEAVKFLSNDNPDSVGILKKALGDDLFVAVRLFDKFDGRKVTPEQFLERVMPQIQGFYDAGVRWYEVHNEPNLRVEGWQHSWKDGREFGVWMTKVADVIRSRFPDVKLGMAGLSPSHGIENVRYPASMFYREAKDSILASCDWVGIHCYWQGSGDDMMWSDSGGMGWKEVNTYGLPFCLTEYSNCDSKVDKTVKGEQYVKYLQHLTRPMAAFAFCSTASSGFESETFEGSTIPSILGARP